MTSGYYDSLAQTSKGFSWLDNNSWVAWILAALVVLWIIFGDIIKDWRRK